jgi:hypothetical protein
MREQPKNEYNEDTKLWEQFRNSIVTTWTMLMLVGIFSIATCKKTTYTATQAPGKKIEQPTIERYGETN